MICKNKELEISQAKTDKDLKALTDSLKALKFQVKHVVSENSLLQNKFVSLKHQYGELEKQKNQVSEKLEVSKRNWAKYANSEKTFKMILDSHSIHKHGIGYNPNFQRKTVTKFINAQGRHTPTCYYCNHTGHVRMTCPFRKNRTSYFEEFVSLSTKGTDQTNLGS